MKTRSRILFFSAVVVAIAACLASQSSAAVFTDRSTFESAITISYLEDFQTLGPGTSGLTGPVALPTGLVVSSPTNNLYTAGPGQSTNPTQAIGSNNPREEGLIFDLGGDFGAFGADFFQNDGGGSQFANPIDYQLQFFDDGGLIDTIVGSVAPNGGSFIGYTGALFDQVIVLSTPTESYEVADNVTVGDAQAIPEPTSVAVWSLLCVSVIGCGWWRRKRAA